MTSPDVTPPPSAPGPAPSANPTPGAGVRLGLRANLAQFCLLVAVNALVGGTLGQERTVVPLLATRTFHLAAFSSALTFILAFGAVKAATNFFAGTLSDRFGRKPVLVAGWLAALPIPPLLILAPNWGWVVAANLLLGINQGLTWSTTVIMKIDLVGPARRGLAMGLNEAAGYGAVAITALVTGYLAAAYGLRPAPFLLGAAYIALGLGLSAAFVRETRGHARHEAAGHVAAADHLGGHLTTRQVAWLTSFSEPALSAACQAGMVNNLNDGVAWGVFPILFARHGLNVSQIGILAALYPAVWGAGQLATGALSDRMAGPVGGRVPAVARRWVRRRRPAGWRGRRRVRDPRGDLGSRRSHRRLWPGRRRAHVRDPACPSGRCLGERGLAIRKSPGRWLPPGLYVRDHAAAGAD